MTFITESLNNKHAVDAAQLSVGTLTKVTGTVKASLKIVKEELAAAESHHKIASDNLKVLDVEVEADTKQSASAAAAPNTPIYAEPEATQFFKAASEVCKSIESLLPLVNIAIGNANKLLEVVQVVTSLGVVDGNSQLMNDAQLSADTIETVLKMMNVISKTVKDTIVLAEAKVQHAQKHFAFVDLTKPAGEKKGKEQCLMFINVLMK